MFLILFWLLLCGGVAALAESKGRSGAGWFFFAFFLSPLLGLIFVACLTNLKKQAEERRRHAELLVALRGGPITLPPALPENR